MVAERIWFTHWVMEGKIFDFRIYKRLMIGGNTLTDRRLDTIGCMVEGNANGWLLLAFTVDG
jgi:hypothetical protein